MKTIGNDRGIIGFAVWKCFMIFPIKYHQSFSGHKRNVWKSALDIAEIRFQKRKPRKFKSTKKKQGKNESNKVAIELTSIRLKESAIMLKAFWLAIGGALPFKMLSESVEMNKNITNIFVTANWSTGLKSTHVLVAFQLNLLCFPFLGLSSLVLDLLKINDQVLTIIRHISYFYCDAILLPRSSSKTRWCFTVKLSLSSTSNSRNSFFSYAWFSMASKSVTVAATTRLARSKSSFFCSTLRVCSRNCSTSALSCVCLLSREL